MLGILFSLVALFIVSCKSEPEVSNIADESSSIAAVSETGTIAGPSNSSKPETGTINATGPQGPMGPQGPQGAKGDPGVQGPKGEKGDTGVAGRDGVSILAGPFDPRPEEGKNEDLFFDPRSGDVYKKVAGMWELISNLMGRRGEKGDAGERGEQGLQGTRGEMGFQGVQGERGTQGETGLQGAQGIQGAQGNSAGIKVDSATTCPEESNGGTKFTTFIDANHDGRLNENETVTSISVVCGGLAGTDGRAGESARITTQLATHAQCPEGGYVFTIQNPDEDVDSFPVCNGAKGLQGLQGPAGTPGSTVTPVKFCASDNSAFPEYGLKINNDIFAVYWGTAPYSSHADTAFLAKVTPGSYRSTGGNGCYFVVNSDLTIRSY